MKKNKLILIAGGTASGKSEIAEKLERSLHTSNFSATKLLIDYYYKPITEFIGKGVNDVNWDHPSSINWKELKRDINLILSGKTIERNVYDFNTSTYIKDETIIIKPSEYIIVEGIYALYDEEILSKAYTKIFVNADSDIRLIRRIDRDKNKRYKEFDLDIFFVKWVNEINPMHKKYIEPSKHESDLIIMNNKDSKQNLEEIIKNISSFVKEI